MLCISNFPQLFECVTTNILSSISLFLVDITPCIAILLPRTMSHINLLLTQRGLALVKQGSSYQYLECKGGITGR